MVPSDSIVLERWFLPDNISRATVMYLQNYDSALATTATIEKGKNPCVTLIVPTRQFDGMSTNYSSRQQEDRMLHFSTMVVSLIRSVFLTMTRIKS